MRLAHRYTTFCILCSLATLVIAQQRNSDNERVLSLEKKWTDAYKKRDISILTSLLADDFIITVEDGSTYGKEVTLHIRRNLRYMYRSQNYLI
jgi:hypothetical protein